jgi:hypothetical protein
MVLLAQVKRTDTLAVAFRPRDGDTAGDEVVRFLALYMQVVVLHMAQQTQRIDMLFVG